MLKFDETDPKSNPNPWNLTLAYPRPITPNPNPTQ